MILEYAMIEIHDGQSGYKTLQHYFSGSPRIMKFRIMQILWSLFDIYTVFDSWIVQHTLAMMQTGSGVRK